jgi:methionyl-tRNA formyltransferase
MVKACTRMRVAYGRRNMRLIVIASSDNSYVRAIVRGALSRELTIAKILIGSRAENFLFRLNSLRRIWSRLGWCEVVARLKTRHTEVYSDTTDQSINQIAARIGIPVIEYDDVNSGFVLAEIAEVRDGLVALAGCGLVGSAFIAAAQARCINGHPALLPGLRGVDVVEWALYEEATVGVTAHLVELSVDAGGIIASRAVPFVAEEGYVDFRKRVLNIQAEVVIEALDAVASDRAKPIPHDISQSQMCYAAPNFIRESAKRKFEMTVRSML